MDTSLARALVTIAVAVAFGIGSLRYNLGTLAEAGPGLFPLIVSMLLLLMGLVSLWQTRQAKAVPLDFKLRGLAVIALSFCGFAFLSQHVNMIVGIVFLVFVAGLAGQAFSVTRSLSITVALVAVAAFMRQALGLDLPLL